MNAGYRVATDGPDGGPLVKGNGSEGLVKAPAETIAGQSSAVHIGVVTSQAYINQQNNSPQGQVGHGFYVYNLLYMHSTMDYCRVLMYQILKYFNQNYGSQDLL